MKVYFLVTLLLVRPIEFSIKITLIIKEFMHVYFDESNNSKEDKVVFCDDDLFEEPIEGKCQQ